MIIRSWTRPLNLWLLFPFGFPGGQRPASFPEPFSMLDSRWRALRGLESWIWPSGEDVTLQGKSRKLVELRDMTGS